MNIEIDRKKMYRSRYLLVFTGDIHLIRKDDIIYEDDGRRMTIRTSINGNNMIETIKKILAYGTNLRDIILDPVMADVYTYGTVRKTLNQNLHSVVDNIAETLLTSDNQYTLYANSGYFDPGMINEVNISVGLKYKTYIRFNKWPEDERSKKHRSDSIVGYEKGVSVFDSEIINGQRYILIPFPVDEGLARDLYTFSTNSFDDIYLVSGNVVGKGHGGEPLLKDLEIIEHYRVGNDGNEQLVDEKLIKEDDPVWIKVD